MPDAKLGRAIAYVLRHREGTIANDGWASIEAVASAVAITRDVLLAHVDSDALRYERDGERIRARHGHSIAVELDHPIAVPPTTLFHGTIARFLPSIRAIGLVRGRRNAVHLSATRDDAMRVGGRRGHAVCIEVRARAAHDDGIAFAKVGDGAVWLVHALPPTHLVIPDR